MIPYGLFGRPIFNGVMLVGQSNAMATGGHPALSTVANRYGHAMFRGGVLMGAARSDDGLNDGTIFPLDYNGLIALQEGLRPQPADWNPLSGETIASGCGAYVGAKTSSTHRLLFFDCARGSTAYAEVDKGSNPYVRGIRHVREAKQRTATYSYRLNMRAVMSVHGESDSQNGSYAANMVTWQNDWKTDLNVRTGQSAEIPMFHTSPSWDMTSPASLQLLSEHVAHPTKNILVGPTYFLPHADTFHRTNIGHRWLGEYYGKAYYKQIILGQQYEPLRPTNVTRFDAEILVSFDNAVGQLVFDTTNVVNPGNFGFTYTDDSSPPAIQSVSIPGTNQVVVTLASVPTGANKKLRYAYSSGSQDGGPITGRRGNLRDSDPEVGPASGLPLWNWCVHFEEAAT